MALRILTFEGTTSSKIYDMTVDIDPANIVLVNAVVKINTAVATHNSISLEIGNTINSNNIIDTDPQNNYLKLPLYMANAGGVEVSSYNPNIGYKMGGHLGRQCKFVVRNSAGVPLGAELVYFCLQFQVLN